MFIIKIKKEQKMIRKRDLFKKKFLGNKAIRKTKIIFKSIKKNKK